MPPDRTHPERDRDVCSRLGFVIFGLQDLARGGRRKVFAVIAGDLGAFPCLNLPGTVHFSEIEYPCTNRTSARRQARSIKRVVAEVRISLAIEEDSIAIAAFALVERPRFFRRRSLKHDSSHRAVVEIAQRRKFHLWMMVHRSSLERIPKDQSQIRETRWRLTIRGGLF